MERLVEVCAGTAAAQLQLDPDLTPAHLAHTHARTYRALGTLPPPRRTPALDALERNVLHGLGAACPTDALALSPPRAVGSLHGGGDRAPALFRSAIREQGRGASARRAIRFPVAGGARAVRSAGRSRSCPRG